ncbi:putative membrane immunity protein [Escherichia phage St11Ph5]|uniref:Putative membrane immunity protein n=1 Tax=Escherichia phage St11Ph5 TaxID=2047765 RepID=A0A2D2W2Z4_9CAUD|nr:immunity to superinfection [Escherichia phage St11Ph5]ATS92498.1 putative membrane immunity protein [Escherichia phage St11Ph5]
MESLAAILVMLFVLAVYLIPTIIAFARGHASKWGIGVLNIVLGWSLVFWVVALIWALSNKGTTIVNVGSGNQYNVSQTSSKAE